VFTNYHIESMAKLLHVDPSIVHSGLASLGCTFLPAKLNGRSVCIPTDLNELCSVCLPLCLYVAPLIDPKRKYWLRWCMGSIEPTPIRYEECREHARLVADALTAIFDAADDCVDVALQRLKESGMDMPSTCQVLQQSIGINDSIPPLFLLSAANERSAKSKHEKSTHPAATVSLVTQDHSVGRWGFRDCKFVVRVDQKGDSYVTMTGKRYSLSEKRLYKLLPFIEKETAVKINLVEEAFNNKSLLECERYALGDEDLSEIQSCVQCVSVTNSDRIEHGGGHALSHVFCLRSNHPLRYPDAVVWPCSEAEVEDIIKLAKRKDWCLIPYGGGTNVTLATQCPDRSQEPRSIISVDMTRMNSILWLNEEDGLACVEAGITGAELIHQLKTRGYTIGHEPDSLEFSTLGGWIATKASGMKKNRYGNIEDIVKDVHVVGIGGVYKRTGPARTGWGRESVGTDMLSLMFGSEGCLGIVTRATVRVWPVPQVVDHDSVLFANFGAGLKFSRGVAQLERNMPASCRLLDNAHFRLGQALQPTETLLQSIIKTVGKKKLLWLFPVDEYNVVCATLLYEGTQEEVTVQKKAVQRLVKMHGGVHLGSKVGQAGYEMTFMIAYLRDFAMTFHVLGESFETFTPWSKLEQIVEATKVRIEHEHRNRLLPGKPYVGCRVTQLYHEGACLYFYFCMTCKGVPNASKVYAEIEHAARETILENGGSLSHHHGVGKLRSDFLSTVDSRPWLQAKRSIKHALDPTNVFGARNGVYHHE
jgi:alkyldihydroxyacetonephosphate synthase